jgi:hypothetical protein
MPDETRKIVSPMRLAIRDEGDWINVYVAEKETMTGSLKVLAMRRSIAELPGAFDELLAFGERLSRIMVDDIFGAGSFIGTTRDPAPEHERGMRAG